MGAVALASVVASGRPAHGQVTVPTPPSAPAAPPVEPAPAAPAPADQPPALPAPLAPPLPEPLPPNPPLAYRERLLGDVNALRAEVGLTALAPAPPEVLDALDVYLGELAPRVIAAGRCANDVLGTVVPSWEYVSARGYLAEPRGFLLLCPTEYYWASSEVARTWATAVGSREYLADREIDTLACGLYELAPDRLAYRAVACVTYDNG